MLPPELPERSRSVASSAAAASAEAARALRWRAKRQRAATRFVWYGRVALCVAFAALFVLVSSVVTRGYSGFQHVDIALEVTFDPAVLEWTPAQGPEALARANVNGLLAANLRQHFPEVTERREMRRLVGVFSPTAPAVLRAALKRDPSLIGRTVWLWLPASDPVAMWVKGKVDLSVPEEARKLKDQQITWVQALAARAAAANQPENGLRTVFNTQFFTNADSREPEAAGFLGAAVGSLFAIAACLLLAFPLGVLTAVYLEEFAPKNRFTDIIEVNINNLAAVPSIVFGLLGVAVYLHIWELPRSAPLVGGLTLALMILPVLIITTRTSLAAVPDSIRSAALALGASPFQVVFHHVLPLAMPGVMTGTILGIARALGETAPLLMIGMVAFIADVPHRFTDPATAMPVQIYLWANNPEMGFVEKTAAGILALLVILVALNLLAIVIRKRFERRW